MDCRTEPVKILLGACWANGAKTRDDIFHRSNSNTKSTFGEKERTNNTFHNSETQKSRGTGNHGKVLTE